MKILKNAGSAVDVFTYALHVHSDVTGPGQKRSYVVAAAIFSHYHNRKTDNLQHIIVK